MVWLESDVLKIEQINFGMDFEKVVKLLEKPEETTTNFSEIKGSTINAYFVLRDHFQKYDKYM